MDALTYIEHFKTTPEWAKMVATVEASPWHREANVAVHTEMVLEQYMTRFYPMRSVKQNDIALIALLFHDVGKPAAEEVVTSEARGTYRRYSGHEQDSAVAFTEHWLRDDALRSLLTVADARIVRWIIEHHLPYGLKDPHKVGAFRAAVEATMGTIEETFYDCLRSDGAGRISDDHEEKLSRVEDWIASFKATKPLKVQSKKPSTSIEPGTAYVLIGPSGSGKSTWMIEGIRSCDKVVSMDRYRLEYLAEVAGGAVKNTPEFYAQAWELATSDGRLFEDFMSARIKDAFKTLAQTGGDTYIDNTNTSRKSRARWVQEARGAGMRVVGVEFWNPLQVVLDRQNTRADKRVPEQSVKSQHFAQTCAWLGSEVDEVIVVAGGVDYGMVGAA